MVKSFGRQNGKQVAQAQREEITSDDTVSTAVNSDRWTTIFTEESTNTKRYAPGYGYGNRDSSEAGYADYDAQTSANGAFTGKFRWVLYESQDEDVPIRIGQEFKASALRNSVSEALTDKQLHPGRVPAGSQDRVLVLEAKADADSDGDTYDPASSTQDSGIPYSMFRK